MQKGITLNHFLHSFTWYAFIIMYNLWVLSIELFSIGYVQCRVLIHVDKQWNASTREYGYSIELTLSATFWTDIQLARRMFYRKSSHCITSQKAGNKRVILAQCENTGCCIWFWWNSTVLSQAVEIISYKYNSPYEHTVLITLFDRKRLQSHKPGSIKKRIPTYANIVVLTKLCVHL